jgi:hypothetical protein
MDLYKHLVDSMKGNSLILGELKTMLALQKSDRAQNVIHPSELCRADFCSRAVCFRLMGVRVPPEVHRFQTEVVFESGHEYHRKWQGWIWQRGVGEDAPFKLRGRYLCLACGHGDWVRKKPEWHASSPKDCVSCGEERRFLRYGELPVRIPDLLISGHADGDLDLGTEVPLEDHPLIEVKSIGEGTLRYDAPNLVNRHTKSVDIEGKSRRWTDYESAWRDIKRPFGGHIKQGTLYALAAGRKRILFLYEYKPTGAIKEFLVTVDPGDVEDELEECRDIVWHLGRGDPPDCPHGGCRICEAYEKAWNERKTREDAPEVSGQRIERSSRRIVRGARVVPAEASEGEGSRARGSSDRLRRSGADGAPRRAQSVDELPDNDAFSRRDRRGGGRGSRETDSHRDLDLSRARLL